MSYYMKKETRCKEIGSQTAIFRSSLYSYEFSEKRIDLSNKLHHFRVIWNRWNRNRNTIFNRWNRHFSRLSMSLRCKRGATAWPLSSNHDATRASMKSKKSLIMMRLRPNRRHTRKLRNSFQAKLCIHYWLIESYQKTRHFRVFGAIGFLFSNTRIIRILLSWFFQI